MRPSMLRGRIRFASRSHLLIGSAVAAGETGSSATRESAPSETPERNSVDPR